MGIKVKVSVPLSNIFWVIPSLHFTVCVCVCLCIVCKETGGGWHGNWVTKTSCFTHPPWATAFAWKCMVHTPQLFKPEMEILYIEIESCCRKNASTAAHEHHSDNVQALRVNNGRCGDSSSIWHNSHMECTEGRGRQVNSSGLLQFAYVWTVGMVEQLIHIQSSSHSTGP